MPTELIVFSLLLLTVIVIVISNIKIVPPSTVYIVERLGNYLKTWQNGIHLKIPFFDRITRIVATTEQIADFPPCTALTRDNISVVVDIVVFFQVTDARRFAYDVECPLQGIENLTTATLRDAIGLIKYNSLLAARDSINKSILNAIRVTTDSWGIQICRVAIQEIRFPKLASETTDKKPKTYTKKEAESKSEFPFMPYDSSESYIFASYAHADRDKVYPIIKRLNEEGYRLWYDEGIDAGDLWFRVITDRLRHSACVLLFWSPEAEKSSWVNKEIHIALNDNIRIVGSIISKAAVPDELVNVQMLFIEDYLDSESLAKLQKGLPKETKEPGKKR